MRVGLRDDPRVIQMTSTLRGDCLLAPNTRAARVAVLGALFQLWSIADQHSTDGTLNGYSAEDLDAEVGLPGFAKALEAVGWLTVTVGALRVPRFLEHNGEPAKGRATSARRSARYRGRHGATVTEALPREDKREDKSKKGGKKRALEEPVFSPPTGTVADRMRAMREATQAPDPEWIRQEAARHGLKGESVTASPTEG
jgi:hypothetical protein